MSNNVHHYFGAYLKIKAKKVKHESVSFECSGGHRMRMSLSMPKYCHECGGGFVRISKTIEVYPTWLCSDAAEILPLEYEDELAIITPPEMFSKGYILAKDNKSGAGEWLNLDYTSEEFNEIFPTQKDIEQLESDFYEANKEVIDLIRKSEYVESAEILAGYVLDAEF